MAEKLAERKIRHASFKYIDENDHHQVAFRGDVVKLPPDAIKRGEEHGAFLKEGEEELEKSGKVTDLSPDSTDAEVRAWMVTASVDDVSSFLSEHPDQAQRILDAEADVAKSEERNVRKGVEKAAEVAAGSNA